tara:strand:+ start:138 stop:1289 length:1152 start_codon:yes stop_codon:yes gene_type:complete
MKKIVLINFTVFIILIVSLTCLLKIINLFVSGPARYYEFVYNLETGNIKNKKKKLVSFKANNNRYIKDNFYKFDSAKYSELGYSGSLVNANCGSLESGITELIFATDQYGYRENLDELYKKTNFLLIGDSFTMSICENKPNDLKSQLQKHSEIYTYLNLGVHGIDYVYQLAIILTETKNTNFDNLIWFFYEGNDYEDNLDLLNEYIKKVADKHHKQGVLEPRIEDYLINNEFKISSFYKFKVWLAETVNGISSLLKYFKTYDVLLNDSEYDQALKIAKNYLEKKNVKNKYIYYIPSWQRLTNYKSKKLNLYSNNPQIIQFDQLKETVRKNAEKNGFIFIDGEEIFINQDNPLKVFHYELNTHFNKYGYNLLATDVYKNIVNKK